MMNQKQYHKLFPQNLTFPHIIIHNQTKDILGTISDDGELHLYEFNKNMPQLKHISLLEIFDDEIALVADWGAYMSGGKIIIGGSKGTILIVDVIQSNAAMFISYSYNVQDEGIVNVKWANRKRQFIGTTTKGKLIHGKLFNEQWIINVIKEYEGYDTNVYAAWQPEDKFVIVGGKDELSRFDLQNGTITQITHSEICSNIKGVMWSPILPTEMSTIVVLTDLSLIFYEYQSTNNLTVLSEMGMKKNEMSYIGWGENHQMVIGYGRQEKKSKGIQYFKQKINGQWSKLQQ